MKIPIKIVFFTGLFVVSLGLFIEVSESGASSREARRARRLERREDSDSSPVPRSPSSDQWFSLSHGGLTRRYLVHIPPSYNPSQATPVILNFHGGGGDVDSQVVSTQMNLTSDKYGFLVVYPEGTGRVILGKLIATFNAGRCCGTAAENKIDDVGFVSKMLDDLSQHFNVDQKRIYATGHSNGSLMCYRLACELSNRIAAIAPVAAQDSFDNCHPARAVPIMHFHGTADPAAKYSGGHCGGRMGKDPGWDCMSVPQYIEKWRKMEDCAPQAQTTYQHGAVTCITYASCAQGSEVTLCTIEGSGHTWPGGQYHNNSQFWKKAVGSITYDISANEAMWDFFQKHPLP